METQTIALLHNEEPCRAYAKLLPVLISDEIKNSQGWINLFILGNDDITSIPRIQYHFSTRERRGEINEVRSKIFIIMITTEVHVVHLYSPRHKYQYY